MKKLDATSYGEVIRSIDKTSCGAVYPLSIAEMKRSGDIYKTDESVTLLNSPAARCRSPYRIS